MRTAAVVILGALLALGVGRCSRSSESLGTDTPNFAPQWAVQEGFAGNQRAEAGARIFAQTGCLACHTYLGEGSQNLGAPDLTAIGRKSPHTEADYARYVANPAKYGNDVMPSFKSLGRTNLLKLGAFLAASKGRR
jgi:mono/diheme cytochrome c family protein